MIRQYRYRYDDWSREVKAGGLFIHDGSLEALARLKLAEEISAICDELIYVTDYDGAANISNTIRHVMLAQGVSLAHSPRPEPQAFIKVCVRLIAEALSLARSGKMRDGLSALALLLCESLLVNERRSQDEV